MAANLVPLGGLLITSHTYITSNSRTEERATVARTANLVQFSVSHHYIVAIRWIHLPRRNAKAHKKIKCSWEQNKKILRH